MTTTDPTGEPGLPASPPPGVPEPVLGTPVPRHSKGRQALIWIAAGALYGLLVRLSLDAHVGDWVGGVMTVSFLLGMPTAVGAITIYGLRQQAPTVSQMILLPWASIGLMLLGTIVTLLEGFICVVLISPLFLGCASLGGLAMGLSLRRTKARRGTLPVVAALPLLMALFEQGGALPERPFEVRRSVVVAATPTRIWNEIVDAEDIRPEELPFSLAHAIGVPKPVEGVNRQTAEGEVRESRWERGVHFRGRVTTRREPETIRWNYEFDPDSFPPGSMDDHVAIGGRYFDLGDTTFTLRPLDAGHTELTIVAHYRVSTPINFYAAPAARLLGTDFVDTILGLYKGRSERARRS